MPLTPPWGTSSGKGCRAVFTSQTHNMMPSHTLSASHLAACGIISVSAKVLAVSCGRWWWCGGGCRRVVFHTWNISSSSPSPKVAPALNCRTLLTAGLASLVNIVCDKKRRVVLVPVGGGDYKLKEKLKSANASPYSGGRRY